MKSVLSLILFSWTVYCGESFRFPASVGFAAKLTSRVYAGDTTILTDFASICDKMFRSVFPTNNDTVSGFYTQPRLLKGQVSNEQSQLYPHNFGNRIDSFANIMPGPRRHLDLCPLIDFKPSIYSQLIKENAAKSSTASQAKAMGIIVQGVGSGKTRRIMEISCDLNMRAENRGCLCVPITFNHMTDLETDITLYRNFWLPHKQGILTNGLLNVLGVMTRMFAALNDVNHDRSYIAALKFLQKLLDSEIELFNENSQTLLERFVVYVVAQMNAVYSLRHGNNNQQIKTFVLAVDEAKRADDAYNSSSEIRHALMKSDLFRPFGNSEDGFGALILMSSLTLSPTGFIPGSSTKVFSISNGVFTTADVFASWTTSLKVNYATTFLLKALAALLLEHPRLVELFKNLLTKHTSGSKLNLSTADATVLLNELKAEYSLLYYEKYDVPSIRMLYHALFAVPVLIFGNKVPPVQEGLRDELQDLVTMSVATNQITAGINLVPQLSMFTLWVALEDNADSFSFLLSFLNGVVNRASKWNESVKAGALLEYVAEEWEICKVRVFYEYSLLLNRPLRLSLADLYGIKDLRESENNTVFFQSQVIDLSGVGKTYGASEVVRVTLSHNSYLVDSFHNTVKNMSAVSEVNGSRMADELDAIVVNKTHPLAYIKTDPMAAGDLIVAHLDVDGKVYVRIREFKSRFKMSINPKKTALDPLLANAFKQAGHWHAYIAFLQETRPNEADRRQGGIVDALINGRYVFVAETAEDIGGLGYKVHTHADSVADMKQKHVTTLRLAKEAYDKADKVGPKDAERKAAAPATYDRAMNSLPKEVAPFQDIQVVYGRGLEKYFGRFGFDLFKSMRMIIDDHSQRESKEKQKVNRSKLV